MREKRFRFLVILAMGYKANLDIERKVIVAIFVGCHNTCLVKNREDLLLENYRRLTLPDSYK
jgi:hypothetical protein